ncbi:uncharacterized protein LOC8078762 isoform X2 [Sorghum bicolor]|uniref:uncharacterized protein LOC8078762 isoform X2 n=1 Tax=Sorghum bicolor TaxID=4558 RepID=UPI000B423A16|nr:uncharacterized protein LOC8078762 isoform X2 [Sorghum bicolor]|eukprot:XP_021312625.1 uncharacterized protein LOC8078762 isoform X2 [Sorghum bicolor]
MAAHAAKKRRPEEEEEAAAAEEVHLAFRGAANALSQVYAHAVAHQKASFVAGERRAMENVHQWLSSQLEEASENEIEHRRGDPVASPQHPSQQQTHNIPPANVQCNPFSFGNIAAALDSRMDETDQTSNSGVPNSLPDPLRQNFHSNHLIQASGYGSNNSCPNRNAPRNNQSPQNQDSVNCNLTASMDMHCDGP